MSRVHAAWLLALGLCGAAHDAMAQGSGVPQAARVEVWGAVTGAVSGPAGSLQTAYSPPLLLDGDFMSRGGQTLKADTGFAIGWTAGVNLFPTSRVGFQIALDRASCDLSGTNSAYTYSLQYVSRQPPDNVAQMVNVNRSIAWPDTSGSLTQLTIAFNAVVRIGRPDRLAATISGGPTYHRLSGAVQPLGFTAFQLGGHSVLFQDDYRLGFSLGPSQSPGFDAGGEIRVPAGGHAAIVAGYRFIGGPHADVAASSTTILNADELTFQQSLADVGSRLALAPMRISVSGSRVFIGVMFTP
jgi:hypothetical protein